MDTHMEVELKIQVGLYGGYIEAQVRAQMAVEIWARWNIVLTRVWSVDGRRSARSFDVFAQCTECSGAFILRRTD